MRSDVVKTLRSQYCVGKAMYSMLFESFWRVLINAWYKGTLHFEFRRIERVK